MLGQDGVCVGERERAVRAEKREREMASKAGAAGARERRANDDFSFAQYLGGFLRLRPKKRPPAAGRPQQPSARALTPFLNSA